MPPLDLSFDAAWGAGLILAIVRVGAFVVASPLFISIPLPGRLLATVALAVFFAGPVESVALPALVVAAVSNAAVGFALGYLTGVILYLFTVAGNLIDTSSTLTAASVFDPSMGMQSAPFGRLFQMTALAVFYLTGGLEMVVRGLGLSVEAIALDGQVAVAGNLADVAVGLATRMTVAAVELALPVLTALFLAEVVMGLASRFAPQANIFLLGLPAKILVALSTAPIAFLLFGEAMDGALRVMRDTFVTTLRHLGG
jgi:flagellar biosynthesis protein FliR